MVAWSDLTKCFNTSCPHKGSCRKFYPLDGPDALRNALGLICICGCYGTQHFDPGPAPSTIQNRAGDTDPVFVRLCLSELRFHRSHKNYTRCLSHFRLNHRAPLSHRRHLKFLPPLPLHHRTNLILLTSMRRNNFLFQRHSMKLRAFAKKGSKPK